MMKRSRAGTAAGRGAVSVTGVVRGSVSRRVAVQTRRGRTVTRATSHTTTTTSTQAHHTTTTTSTQSHRCSTSATLAANRRTTNAAAGSTRHTSSRTSTAAAAAAAAAAVQNGVNEDDRCAICLDDITQPKKLGCGHTFCASCIAEYFHRCQEKCPTCGKVLGVLRGNQPPGKFSKSVMQMSLPGYEQYKTIRITYSMPDGIQTVSAYFYIYFC